MKPSRYVALLLVTVIVVNRDPIHQETNIKAASPVSIANSPPKSRYGMAAIDSPPVTSALEAHRPTKPALRAQRGLRQPPSS